MFLELVLQHGQEPTLINMDQIVQIDDLEKGGSVLKTTNDSGIPVNECIEEIQRMMNT